MDEPPGGGFIRFSFAIHHKNVVAPLQMRGKPRAKIRHAVRALEIARIRPD
jgi:hypothetical protein